MRRIVSAVAVPALVVTLLVGGPRRGVRRRWRQGAAPPADLLLTRGGRQRPGPGLAGKGPAPAGPLVGSSPSETQAEPDPGPATAGGAAHPRRDAGPEQRQVQRGQREGDQRPRGDDRGLVAARALTVTAPSAGACSATL